MATTKYPPVLRSIILAEFDIDKGSVVRLEYPDQFHDTTSQEDLSYIAEQMLPDGTDKQVQMVTLFMLNRPEDQPVQRIPVECFQLKSHEHVDEEGQEGEDNSGSTLRVHQQDPTSSMSNSSSHNEKLPSAWRKLSSELGAEVLIIEQCVPSSQDPSSSYPLESRVGVVGVMDEPQPPPIIRLSSKGNERLLIDPMTWCCEILPDGVPAEILSNYPDLVTNLSTTTTSVTTFTSSSGEGENNSKEGVSAESKLKANRGKPPYFLFLKAPTLPQRNTSNPQSKGSNITAQQAAGEVGVYGLVLSEASHVTTVLTLFRSNSEILTMESTSRSETTDSIHVFQPAPNITPEDEDASHEVEIAPREKTVKSSSHHHHRSNGTIYGLNTIYTKKDSSVRRGGINKAIALTGENLTYLMALQPVIPELLEYCCTVKGSDPGSIQLQREAVATVFDAVKNALVVPPSVQAQAVPSDAFRDVQVHCLLHPEHVTQTVTCSIAPFTQHEPTSSSTGKNKNVQFRFPLRQPKEELMFTGGLNGNGELAAVSVVNLLRFLKEDFFSLLTAMLMSKRVVILSKSLSACEVNHVVLGFGLVMTSVFPMFLEKRVFPYASIGCVERVLHVPGFVVGTLNPLLEAHQEWWDLCLDLDQCGVNSSATHAQRVRMKESIRPFVDHPNHLQYDQRLLKELLIFIDQSAVQRVMPEVDLEMAVRYKLKEYLSLMIRCGLTNENWHDQIRQDILNKNMLRLMAIHSTTLLDDWRMGYELRRRRQSSNTTPSSSTVKDVSLSQIAMTLRHLKNPEDIVIMQLLQQFLRYVHTQEQVIEMLAEFPAFLGGLAPICTLLFHPSKAVQLVTLAVLRLVDKFPISKPAITNLNSFLMLAYEQCNRVMPDTAAAFAVK